MPMTAHYQDPPWVLTPGRTRTRKDILPAGRPGVVLEDVPTAIAEAVVTAANAAQGQAAIDSVEALGRAIEALAEVLCDEGLMRCPVCDEQISYCADSDCPNADRKCDPCFQEAPSTRIGGREAPITERPRHDYQGLCPDDEQPNARDPECPACQVMEAPRTLPGASSNNRKD